MMLRSCCSLLLLTACLAQRPSTGDRQIRLEDIERDNLAAQKTSQQSSTPTSSQRPQQTPQQSLSQQQLAAYQQQLLLQQLQQQYFAPTTLAYGNFGGVPLMIIPSNHLGVGAPPVPIQAYFVPADPSYVPQVYQPYPVPSQRYQPQREFTVPRLQSVSQDLNYNVQVQPSVQTYRPQNFPSASIVYAGTPSAPAYQPTYQQPSQQQLYNAYNALYQQRQEKNSFAAGVKSTPAPPLKTQGQVYSAQPTQTSSPVYSNNYKGFNYNQ
ncbi:uncharacterized protein LOC128987062 [Macrosteles quadrilineatus]|uniref:uncharacterized protein LOC128987062 n=1 Tax=Macrosteles quadrilineatus TaxID=74068 RepID=UPI0023E1201E|nr:uncharacterized protein LOC128987062 [Macrosteles quadrilineatus]